MLNFVPATKKRGLHWTAYAALRQPISKALRVLEVLLYIHAVVEYADHNNLGFSASSVKNDMATLAKLFVSWFYIFCIAPNLRLSSKEPESIVKLLEVLVALTSPPPLSGKAANINYVFSSASLKKIA